MRKPLTPRSALLGAALAAILVLPVTLQAAPAVRAPVITGTAQVGATLTAAMKKQAPAGTTYVFRWQTRKRVTVKKKVVTKWVVIAGARRATFTPSAAFAGARVRACVKRRAKQASSAWKCSRVAVVAAAGAPAAPLPAEPAPAAPLPAEPAPATPAPLSISYPTQRFITGSANVPLPATVTGGSGTKRFQVSAGTLPQGVAFDQTTGAFTGPAASAWDFQATQITAGDFHTCALTTSGGVKCWGYNASGQLGDSATTNRDTPVDVVATGGSGTLANITQIAAGGNHTCALTIAGGVKCWGQGGDGQLGNDATVDRTTPVDVVATGGSGLLEDITQIAAGAYHTCALTTSGGVKCWGYNASGQLGDSATTNRDTPVDVVATGGSGTLANITQIAAGGNHTCALTTSSGVKCWGRGAEGQLGNDGEDADEDLTIDNQTTPVDVVATGGSGTLAKVTQLTAGGNHTCALVTSGSGSAKCWGQGLYGRLGNDADESEAEPANDEYTPVNVVVVDTDGSQSPLAGITQIAAGGPQACALTTSGGVKCWGKGSRGQLGNAQTTNQYAPVDVVATDGSGPLEDITQIAVGGCHACALTASGGVTCWGKGLEGQLGNDDSTTSNANATPVNVATSGEHPGYPVELTVTVTDDTGSASTPVKLDAVSKPWLSYPSTLFTMGQDAKQVTPSASAGSGTKQFSVSGTLPDGVTFNETTGAFTGPAASAWNFRATQVSVGGGHTCALTIAGGVKCWGYGGDGQLGNGASGAGYVRTTPVDVVATGGSGLLEDITQIAAGDAYTCALTTSGGVKCWGRGAEGQLGNDDATTDRDTPVDVVATGGGPYAGITQIAAGGAHTCALVFDGSVECWGYNASGQLGNEATTNRVTPVGVVATGGSELLANITQIAAGGNHTCALTIAGGVKCWGQGGDGQLGDSATTNRDTPVDVVATGGSGTLANITQITAGGAHTCALTTSGGVKCWGYNASGQLGDSATTNRDTPVDVVATGGSGTLEDITQIAAGDAHTCALTNEGGVKCWGYNAEGQLGNNGEDADGDQAIDNQTTPVKVTKSGEQSGFPAALSVTVTDDTGSWTLGRVVLRTR